MPKVKRAHILCICFVYFFHFFSEIIFLIFIGKYREKSSFYKFSQKIHIQMSKSNAAELTSAFFMYMFHVFFYFCGVKKSVQFAHVDLDYVCSPKELVINLILSKSGIKSTSYQVDI